MSERKPGEPGCGPLHDRGLLPQQVVRWAHLQPDHLAFIYLSDGENESERLTYAQLEERVAGVARWLLDRGMQGQRVLLFYPYGLEFVCALFGCMRAGAIAVPAHAPDSQGLVRAVRRLRAIIRDARPDLVLSTGSVIERGTDVKKQYPELKSLPLVSTDSMYALEEVETGLDGDVPALLQYTSGSTSAPKGVSISHRNIAHNMALSDAAASDTEVHTFVSWLPPYHDMGLIGAIMWPAHRGMTSVLMSPTAFVRKPIRWLRAIERYSAPASVAPNFGFELCIRRIGDDEAAALDLTDWRIAFVGAEPVRAGSMERFCETFAVAGLRPGVLRPCYGLAEATLAIAIKAHSGPYLVGDFDSSALEQRQIAPAGYGRRSRRLVGCGGVLGDQSVQIVQPDTGQRCGPHEVGEIWVAGDSVATGYCNVDEREESGFGARLAGDPRDYLRTGDLGFFFEGELFVCGRLKDLIILRGVNHHPEDIERTVQSVSNALIAAGGAAFSIDVDGEEKVVAVQELDTRMKCDMASLSLRVRESVAFEHELALHDLIFIKRGSLPKTSSGKVQRRVARDQYLASSLSVLEAGPIPAERERNDEPKLRQICSMIARSLGSENLQIDPQTSLAVVGLDSLRVTQLQAAIEQTFGVHVELKHIYQSRNPADLSALVAQASPTTNAERSMLVPSSSDDEETFELTPMQQAYWVGRRPDLAGGNVCCHVYAEYDFPSLDIQRLSDVIEKLMIRHPSLRTVIEANGRQRVLPPPSEQTGVQAVVRTQYLSALPRSETEARLLAIREELSHHVRDASSEPPFVLAASVLDDRTRLHISVDLIAADFLSVRTLVSEAVKLYQGAEALPPFRMTFRDFVEAKCRHRKSIAYARDRDYWLVRIPALAPPPALPEAAPLEACGKPRYRRLRATLEADRWLALRARARVLGATPTGLLCAIFLEVLRRWSASDDLSIVLTLFDRPRIHADIDRVVGDFTSSIVFSPPSGAKCFADRVADLQDRLWEDMEHVSYDGVDVLRVLSRSVDRVPARGPAVVLTSALGHEGRSGPPLDPSWFRFGYSISQTPQVTLDHQVVEVGGELYFNWDFVEQVYPPGLVDAMFEAYRDALERLACDAEIVQRADIVALPADQLAVRERTNATAAAIPDRNCLSGFERQARLRPDELAFIGTSATLTYGELYERARGLAARLYLDGVHRETLVAIVLPKSWQQVVAVLAVQMAGGAYVPLDPAQPAARLRLMLNDCRARHVIASHASEVYGSAVVHRVDDCTTEPRDAPLPEAEPADLAYVIYTSGTSGQPKGVMIEHRSVVNRMSDMNSRFAIGDQDRVLALTALHHDMSVYDIFGVLAAGGAIVMPTDREARDPAAWVRLIEAHGVSVWNSVPAFFSMLLAHLAPSGILPSSLRHVWLSGDWIPVREVARVRKDNPSVSLVGLGGATETTIWDIHFPVSEVDESWSSVPYGTPLANAAYHVLDDHGRPCPDWVAGELYAEGVGLARGYRNDLAKSRERFVTFSGMGRRVYRTGDVGRYRADGTIELLGRADQQLKIRGHRVEPAEVESALTRHPSVRAAAVVAVGERSRQRLVAYAVAAGEVRPDEAELRTHLRAYVPPHQIPSHLVWIPQLPLSATGKVDRDVLAKRPIGSGASPPAYSLPEGFASVANTIELIEQGLGIRGLRGGDNLNDLGVTSVDLVRLAAEAQQRAGALIEMDELFAATTVSEVQAMIDARARVSGRAAREDLGSTGNQLQWGAVADMLECSPAALKKKGGRD